MANTYNFTVVYGGKVIEEISGTSLSACKHYIVMFCTDNFLREARWVKRGNDYVIYAEDPIACNFKTA